MPHMLLSTRLLSNNNPLNKTCLFMSLIPGHQFFFQQVNSLCMYFKLNTQQRAGSKGPAGVATIEAAIKEYQTGKKNRQCLGEDLAVLGISTTKSRIGGSWCVVVRRAPSRLIPPQAIRPSQCKFPSLQTFLTDVSSSRYLCWPRHPFLLIH